MSSIGESDLDSSLRENKNSPNGRTTGSRRVSETKNYAEVRLLVHDKPIFSSCEVVPSKVGAWDS